MLPQLSRCIKEVGQNGACKKVCTTWRRLGGALTAMSAPPAAGPLRPLSHTEPTAAAPSRATPTILTRFSCCRCGFESHVDYHGRTPPFNRSIVFLENVFLIRSPMGDANRPLCLGGTCVVWCAAKTLRSLTTTQGTAAHTNEPRLRAAPLARGHTRVRAHGNWC